jgi:L-iditol 2-dehydrogenase
MKALVKYAAGFGNVGLRDVPEPTPDEAHVKVAIEYGGICGTDLHVYRGTYRSRPPVTMGHEWSGRVVELGPGVDSVQVGERVTSIPAEQTCGKCRYCLVGHIYQCEHRLSFGTRLNGAFAAYGIVAADRIRRLPDGTSFKAGALTEPLACCVKAVAATHISAGDVVVVSGPGPIGLLTLQLAKLDGAYVVLTGTSADRRRLEIGRQLGADLTLNVETDDVDAIVRGLTQGYGADVVLECSGTPAATRSGFQVVRREGKFTQIGLHEEPFQFDFLQVLLKEVNIVASFSSSFESWDRALLLMDRGKLDLEAIVSDVLPLTEWETAWRKIEARDALKILLTPVG